MLGVNNDPSYLVIMPITNDINELEDAWNRYQELPIELMQDSDDACIAKYGVNNQTMYQRLKAKLDYQEYDTSDDISVTDDYDSIMSEGFALPIGQDEENFIIDDNLEVASDELLEKIKLAQSMQSDTMVIIYPYTTTYPYTLDELENVFARYNMLSWDLQQMSDQESMKLFNYDVRNMYYKNKNKILSMQSGAMNESVDTIYFNSIPNVCESINNTFILKRKLDLINLMHNGNLLESTIAEDSLKNLDIAIQFNKDISDSVPEIVPFFTPLEIDDINSGFLSEDEKKYIHYLKAESAKGYKGFDSKAYKAKLEQVQNLNQPYDIIMRGLLIAGWNPNLPLTEKAFNFSRNRQIKYLKEYSKINVVDVRNEVALAEGKTNVLSFTLRPIFLLAGLDMCYISLEPELGVLFDDNKDYIPFDLIMKDTDINVYALFVDTSTFMELSKSIKNAKYNTELFNAMRNNISDKKRLCSIFIDVISAMTNLERNNDPKVYHIFSGQKMYYTADKANKVLEAILSDTVGFVMRKYTVKDAVDKVFKEPSVENYKMIRCNESEIEANLILDELNFLYTADSVLTEKAFPVTMNDKGLYIELPTQIEEEYQTLHKSLLAMEKEGNYEAMKPAVAHLWYLNLLCERKINKYKDKDNKVTKLKVSRDVRARILNDFKKYLKMVVANDASFNFTSYFKKSIYNDRRIFINQDTLRYTAKIVTTVVKTLLSKKP